MADLAEVLRFWFKEIPSERHFKADPAFDALVRRRFEGLWREAQTGVYDAWQERAEGALALIILFDQFPRNMFRGLAEAFSTDARARDIARPAIAKDLDLSLAERARFFFYLPLMHSENLDDQDLCVKLTAERLGEQHFSMGYARLHRDAVARFGRFPARNSALGRSNTPQEDAFLKANPSGF